MRRGRIRGLIVPFIVAATTAIAAPRAAPTLDLDGVLAAHPLKGARVGVAVVALPGGETLYAHGADDLAPLASNTKLVTTAAAIDRRGPDAPLVTTLYATGKARDGVLEGDLLVVGGGDPFISGRLYGGDPLHVVDIWAKTVKGLGVTRVAGSIVVDATFFDDLRVAPGWPADQRSEWYEAEVAAVALNDNCVDVTVEPGEIGAPARVRLSPPTAYVRVVNKTVTVADRKAHVITLRRIDGTRDVEVGGRVWAKGAPFTGPVTVPDPALFLACVFRERLEAAGVHVEGPDRKAAAPVPTQEFLPLVVHTNPLSAATTVANKRSQNLVAEMLWKGLAARPGAPGSFASGADAAAEFLAGVGIPRGSYTLVDGSGLSREDRMTPSQICRLLAAMRRHKSGALFESTLPAGGEEGGSLARRFAGVRGRERVRAKTGHINGVSNLSGYVRGRTGEGFAFSILCSDLGGRTGEARDLEDEIAEALLRAAD